MSESEAVEALPVLASEQSGVATRRDGGVPAGSVGDGRAIATIPAVQAAAAAASGFVAGAAIVSFMGHRRRREELPAKGRRARRERAKLGRRGSRRSPSAGELIQIVGSRSLLVDVHLLGGSGKEG